MGRWSVRASILVGLALVVDGRSAWADEDGVSFWLLGTYATQSAVPGESGLSLETTYYSAGATASQSASPGRRRRVRVDTANASNYMMLTPTYTFETPVAGGQLGVGVTGLWGNYATTETTTVFASSGASRSRSTGDSMTAFGDVFPTVTLKWNSGVNNFMTYATVNVPLGGYDSTRQATVGMGHWAIDGGAGYTWYDEGRGLEFTTVAGLTYNFTNPDTAYQSGVDLHVELSGSKNLTEHFLAGVASYFYQQITGDSGTGATRGEYLARVAGVGPELGYNFMLGRHSASLSARGYYEFAGQNRTEGWTAWLTLVVSLGASGAKASAP
jgi:hypothetical protein